MMTNKSKSDSSQPPLLTGDNMDDLAFDLWLLKNDYELAQSGFEFRWLISYTELYRYLYPSLELLTTIDRKYFFWRQFALRYHVEKVVKSVILLREVKEEHEHHVRSYEGVLRELILGTSDRAGLAYLRWLTKNDHYHKDRYLEFDRIVEDSLASKKAPDEVTQAVMIALKAIFLRREYSFGRAEYSRLIDQQILAEFDRDRESELEGDAQTSSVKAAIVQDFKIGYLDKPRTLANLAGSISKVIQLNRSCMRDRRVYVMLADITDFVREKTMTASLYEPLDRSDYKSEFHVLRSLNYCLLDIYMSVLKPNLEERIEEVRRFYYRIKELQPMQHSKSSIKPELRDELGKIQVRLREMETWFEVKTAIDDRIRRNLLRSEEVESDEFLPSPEFIDRLQKLIDRPEEIFSELKIAHERLDTVLKSMSSEALRLRRIVLPTPSIYLGSYNPKLLQAEDLRVGVEWLNDRFSELQSHNFGHGGLEEIKQQIESKLSKHVKSTALRVLFSIVQRLLGEFRAAEESLRIASGLYPENPEVAFQEALLIRFKIDAAVTNLNKEDMVNDIKVAIQKVRVACESGYEKPMYFQFMAYLYWRKARILVDDNLEALTDEAREAILEAVGSCQKAVDQFKTLTDDRGKSEVRTITLDLVYYLSLIGGRDRVKYAAELMSDIAEDLLTPRQIDTKALVLRRLADLTDSDQNEKKLDLLRQSIRLYCLAATKLQDDRDRGLVNQYLGSTLAAYVSAGGTNVDLLLKQ